MNTFINNLKVFPNVLLTGYEEIRNSEKNVE